MSNELYDEVDLVQRAKQGDRAAFAALYEQHQPVIYTYVFYRVGSTPLAEDLTAEVFVRMVEKIRTFRGGDRPLLAWLYTIAGNLVVDHYRRSGRIEWQPLAGRPEIQAGTPDLDQVVEARLDNQALVAAMQHLTEEQRQVILLKFFGQRSNDETAAVLGKSAGAIKSLQHRALAALGRLLPGSNDDDR